MNIKTRILSICMFAVLFASCQEGYEQEYPTFNEFNKANVRNKGWFPKIILRDANNLKNVSYLDSHSAFGKFLFTNFKAYDSVFSSNQKIDFETFKDKVDQNSGNKPEWFIDTEKASDSNFSLIKQDRFYMLKNNGTRTIYFVLDKT